MKKLISAIVISILLTGLSIFSMIEETNATGFDLSSLEPFPAFNVAGQETYPTGVAFNTDGTKMFVIGYSGDDVNEYTLSTAFDVSTASFVDAFSVAAQETAPQGVAFNPRRH